MTEEGSLMDPKELLKKSSEKLGGSNDIIEKLFKDGEENYVGILLYLRDLMRRRLPSHFSESNDLIPQEKIKDIDTLSFNQLELVATTQKTGDGFDYIPGQKKPNTTMLTIEWQKNKSVAISSEIKLSSFPIRFNHTAGFYCEGGNLVYSYRYMSQLDHLLSNAILRAIDGSEHAPHGAQLTYLKALENALDKTK